MALDDLTDAKSGPGNNDKSSISDTASNAPYEGQSAPAYDLDTSCGYSAQRHSRQPSRGQVEPAHIPRYRAFFPSCREVEPDAAGSAPNATWIGYGIRRILRTIRRIL
jgi:hypothetical protein